MPKRRILGLAVFFLWFFIGGMGHVAVSDLEMRIVSPIVPWPRAAVWVSGACELLAAAGLLWAPTRRWAGFGLFALTIALTPANVYMLQRPELFAHRCGCSCCACRCSSRGWR